MPVYDHGDDELQRHHAAAVEALHRAETYPHRVDAVEAIETHMAWVFLTDRFAYKLKKPVRTRFFDHRTVEARRRACAIELELNRRLAADVYLDVVPLTRQRDRFRVAGTGINVDWLVKMRRLPRQRMLHIRIESDTVFPQQIDRLAARLFSFYASARSPRISPQEYRGRLTEDIAQKCRDLARPHYGLDPTLVSKATRHLQRWIEFNEPLLEARAHLVVDAHGDLRPEHICLEPRPVVIDCLEFDRTLRLLDPLSELCFLSLECDRLGAPWIGERLIGNYVQQCANPAPAPLIPFYHAYHAIVRAAVAIWHIDDEALDHTEKWRHRGTWYLQKASDLLQSRAMAG